MAKPRILIFSTAYYPLVGGAEVAIKEITDRLPGFDFTLITARLRPNLPRFELVGSVAVYRTGRGSKLDKFWLPVGGLGLAKSLQRQAPFDLIWSMMASQASVAAARFKKRNPAIPLVLTLQEGDEEEHLTRYVLGNQFLYRLLIRPFHLAIFHVADFITVISWSLVERAKLIRQNIPIEVIPNGVDLTKFSAPDATVKFLKSEQTERCLITTSRLVKKNGVGDLIKALSYLPENIKLQILGTGPDEKMLQELTVELRVGERVQFLGHISGEQLPDYLARADVFVRPSLSEGLGNSFLEAMAAGLPTIGTPVGGIVDFLHEGQTGWLCAVNDPQSIAEKVLYVLDPANKEEVAEVAERAKQLVAEKYDWIKVAETLGQVFLKLCPK